MENEDYNDIGLFRFRLIAPAINKNHGFSSNEEYFNHVSKQTYTFNNKEYTFSKSCIKSWYFSYLRNGYESLKKKKRKDNKRSRKLDNDTIQRIITLRNEYPNMNGTRIYERLIDEGYINKLNISLDTVLRFIKVNNLKCSQVAKVDRRMFEMEHVNDCWMADSSSGPYIKIDNKKYRTYIILFIDDKSRMIMGFDIFFSDTAINMQKVFKNALKTYGKPKKLFVDNGGPYANKQLKDICARVGVQLIHAKIYSPESKSKVERMFRTIKDGWMRCTDWNEFKTLEDVKTSLKNFLYTKYINEVHSSTGETPNNRWHNEYKYVKILDEKFIDDAFLHSILRKVNNDRTIKFNNKNYEVPYKYIGQTIEIRYDPNELDEIIIFDDGKKIICKEVDKVANSRIKRKSTIDYSKIKNDERDVEEKEGE